MHYYNEFDKKTAAWLRELIAQGHLPKGHVDDRSIVDVQPGDLDGYVQCHFFAGIGGWPYALMLAGWPAEWPVWTGSCPCQPFSCAGKGKGTDDERHLWPEFARLIGERRPTTVFGEQVASKAGREWLAGVFADLEGMGYAAAGADLCAAGVGAPHIRQRLFWVADNTEGRREMAMQYDRSNGTPYGVGQAGINGSSGVSRRPRHAEGIGRPGGAHDDNGGRRELAPGCADAGGSGGLPNSEGAGPSSRGQEGVFAEPGDGGGVGGLQHATRDGREQRRAEPSERGAECGCGDGDGGLPHASGAGSSEFGWGRDERTGLAPPGFWSDFDILPFRDGKARRVEPGTFPLAHGIPARVVRLRGYGNAIVPQVAAEFIKAYIEASLAA